MDTGHKGRNNGSRRPFFRADRPAPARRRTPRAHQDGSFTVV